MTRRIPGEILIGWLVILDAALIYWLCNRFFDAYRGDLFYLADAFLHGRTWLEGFAPGPYDVITVAARSYVPFAPFPAIALMPLVALIGPVTADQLEPAINAILAAAGVGLCWMLLGRIGVPRIRDRVALAILFGFSTQILWVTSRGGVWHTGHLIATILTFGCLIELWGKQRALLVGLMAGAAFLTRAPLAFAIPFYALWLDPWRSVSAPAVAGTYIARARRIPWRAWTWLAIGVLPSIAFFFLYNQVRFGSPLESGYALATLPPFLEDLRRQGLFSVVHIPMNIEYLFLKVPTVIDAFPFIRPDGLGMSIFLTSPGLLYALRADWRRSRTWLLAGATVAVLIPTLLYYGGGWFQYGFRYFLDSVPFVMALCGLAAVHRKRIGNGWFVLIAFGVAIMFIGVYWSYNLH